MIVVLIVFLCMLPMAVKRMVGNGFTRSSAVAIWLMCTLLVTGAGYVVFGPV